MPKLKIDLTDHVYGRLTVIGEAEPVGYTRRWLCRCSCGQSEDFIVNMPNLRSGKTTSCGCLRKERTSAKNSIDLIGRIFGRLTVIERIGVSTSRKVLWKCECECGLVTVATTDNLKNGTTKSCGCLRGDAGKALQAYDQKLIAKNSGVYTPVLTSKLRSDNTSGVKGVHTVKTKKGVAFVATIKIKKQTIYLGRFTTLKEAAKARKRAEEEYHHPYLNQKKKATQ